MIKYILVCLFLVFLLEYIQPFISENEFYENVAISLNMTELLLPEDHISNMKNKTLWDYLGINLSDYISFLDNLNYFFNSKISKFLLKINKVYNIITNMQQNYSKIIFIIYITGEIKRRICGSMITKIIIWTFRWTISLIRCR